MWQPAKWKKDNNITPNIFPCWQESSPFLSKLSSLRKHTRARNLVTSFRYMTVVLFKWIMAMDSLSYGVPASSPVNLYIEKRTIKTNNNQKQNHLSSCLPCVWQFQMTGGFHQEDTFPIQLKNRLYTVGKNFICVEQMLIHIIIIKMNRCPVIIPCFYNQNKFIPLCMDITNI